MTDILHGRDHPGVEIHADGHGPDTIVMVHGWPDTWRLWDAQVEALAPRHRCVRFTLPGFAPADERRARGFAEVVETLHRVVLAGAGGRPVTLLLHDWGCLYGYRFAALHPELVARVAALDVGDGGSTEHLASLGAAAKLGIFAYQNWLSLAWRIGGPVGDAMTRGFARRVRAPADAASIGSHMNYPYWIRWGRSGESYAEAVPFEPVVPTLFAYAARKPFMLHSPAWAARIAAAPGSRVLAMDAGHWLMHERPDELNAALVDWLAATDAGTNADGVRERDGADSSDG